MSNARTSGTSPRLGRKRLPASERRDLIETAAAQVFAMRGYDGASIDQIASRAGVTAPVLYDHFTSKLDLYRQLLERTRGEFVEVWRTNLASDLPPEQRFAHAVDAWARYIETHADSARMYFRETTGDRRIHAIRAEIQAGMRAALGTILKEKRETPSDEEALEMAAEVIRAGLAGLANWWSEHPDVPRERIVKTAMDTIWIGLERSRRGERSEGLAEPSSTTSPRGTRRRS